MCISLLLKMINGFSWPAKVMVSPFNVCVGAKHMSHAYHTNWSCWSSTAFSLAHLSVHDVKRQAHLVLIKVDLTDVYKSDVRPKILKVCLISPKCVWFSLHISKFNFNFLSFILNKIGEKFQEFFFVFLKCSSMTINAYLQLKSCHPNLSHKHKRQFWLILAW